MCSISEEAIEVIAKEAARRAGGARSMYAILEAIALKAAMECSDQSDLKALVIDAGFVHRTLTAAR